jgi:phosphoribosylanthranilate isomerase
MTLVKVCGIRTAEEGAAALSAGADWLGFVFYPPSPRNVSVEQAASVIRSLRQDFADWSAVAVYVDPSLEQVQQAVAACGFNYVQLHGDEAPALVQSTPVPAIKALRVERGGEAVVAEKVSTNHFGAGRYMLDTHSKGLYGGTGETFDWLALRHVAAECIVAGGLHAGNVRDALETLAPFGVDVSSGVEYAGGGKDPAAIRAFLEAVRNYDGALSHA